jgi:ParB/Sulfiredoxin domain
VDELLGDAPLRTVPEIPNGGIEPPLDATDPDDATSIEELEESVRQLGVLEPLLVGRRGLEYRVIAGMRRLLAARTVGVSTVRCLLHDVDDQKLTDMREGARRPIPPPVVPGVPEPSASGPGVAPAPHRGLRDTVMAALADVEQLRAKTASAAADILARSPLIARAPVSCRWLVEAAVSAVATEVRLRGIKMSVTNLRSDSQVSLDGSRCRVVLTGLLQAMLALSRDAGTVLDVRAQVTTVRPALIVDCEIRNGMNVAEEALPRFFDADWTEHPCGPDGAVMLAALARAARAHGGRVNVQGGTLVTFVVPTSLSDL